MTETRIPWIVFVLAACVLLAGGVSTLAAEESEDDDEGTPQGGQDAGAGYLESLAAPAGATSVTEQELTPGEMRELEERLQGLSEEIFRSRAKLKQLRDQLRYTSVAVINAAIYHNQKTSGAFRLLSVRYTLDGFEIFQDVNHDGHLTRARRLPVFKGSLLPGEHLLEVDLQYKGRGFGIFSYLKNYTFHVKSRYTFVVDEGEVFDLNVTASDHMKGLEVVGPLRDRLKVKFVREARHEP